jgi:hypothetical protein
LVCQQPTGAAFTVLSKTLDAMAKDVDLRTMTPDHWTMFRKVLSMTDHKLRALVLQETDLTEAKLHTIANNYETFKNN